MDKCQRDEYSDGPIVYVAETDRVSLSMLCNLLYRVNRDAFRGWTAQTLQVEFFELDRSCTLSPDGTPRDRIRILVRFHHKSNGHDCLGVPGLYRADDFGPLDAILPEQPQPREVA